MSQPPIVSRRQLLAGGAVLAAGAVGTSPSATTPAVAADSPAGEFRSRWRDDLDRTWLGAEYWAAPLQDWQVFDGAAELRNAAPNRMIYLLTRELADRRGSFTISVKISRADGKKFGDGKGSAGFRLGIRGPLGEYRNAVLYGKGLDVGIATDGTLFVGSKRTAAPSLAEQQELELQAIAEPADVGYTLTLHARSLNDSNMTATVVGAASADQMTGLIALVTNFGGAEGGGAKKAGAKKNAAGKGTDGGPNFGVGTFRFADWTVSGDKIDAHDDRAFGPILFSQYTLSQGVLKLTAQMPPLGIDDDLQVALHLGEKKLEAPIHPEARTATFRVDGWQATDDVPYQLSYTLLNQKGATKHEWTGTIRREPLDKPTLVVADVSCNTHAAFPNARFVEHMRKADPDLIAFVGDQFYESTAGYGVTTQPLEAAFLDYLRKWYVHGWTWRELTRDRPSLSLPDDHDVYQGNIWGENGAPQGATQECGGYRMPGPWVNVVYRTQTSHHPDPHDPTPVEQEIMQFYGRLVYGGVDFAILADRQYKTGPEGAVPATGGRADHVTDPNFDPQTVDLPGLILLGERQEKFLADWADDRLAAAPVKAVISQTIFTGMATTHGSPNGRLVADYDTNGWPQTPRNRAVRLIKKAGAFHIAGDQHLPAVVQYGADSPRDGSYAFAGPAVNVGYPRWWEPLKPGANRVDGESELLGDFLDSFGNHLRVVAVANGAKQPRTPILEAMTDKASGLGLVRFDKAAQKIVVECWPYDVDPTAPGAKQFAGWPVTVDAFPSEPRT